MDQVDLIWQNGELVAWEDAKVHVLTHGLHYGTGVFEGIRAYETPQGPGIFRHRTTSSGCSSRRSSTTCRSRSRSRSCGGDARADAANGLRECYIRPIAFRGYGQLGLYPLDARSRCRSRSWPWGAYLGEESKRPGHPRQGLELAADPPDALIPHAKASGQYLNSVLAKIEASKAGYQEAILLDSHGFVCEGSGENIYVVRDGEISRRRRRRRSSTASTASRSSRSRGTSATRSSSATSPGPSCTSPTRCSCRAPRPSSCRCARSTIT